MSRLKYDRLIVTKLKENVVEAAWGSMISDGRNYLLRAPMLSFAPGFALMMAVFGFTMVGDGLRDALDPRLRGVI